MQPVMEARAARLYSTGLRPRTVRPHEDRGLGEGRGEERSGWERWGLWPEGNWWAGLDTQLPTGPGWGDLEFGLGDMGPTVNSPGFGVIWPRGRGRGELSIGRG